MKRFFIFVLAAVLTAFTFTSCALSYGRKDQIIHLDEVAHPASVKKYQKSTKMNQYEIMLQLVREAQQAYDAANNVEAMYELRATINSIMAEYLRFSKQSMPDVQRDLNLLNEKVDRSIRMNDPHAGYNDGYRTNFNYGHELD